MTIQSINPATGETLETFEPLTEAQVGEKLEKAARAFERHRRTSFAERAEQMNRAAEILESEKEDLGRTITEEMGKTYGAAVAEAQKCAWVCRYYAENAERLLSDETIETEAERSFVRFLPIGPVLAVMPWNFPLWQVFRFAAPALMAGNVGLLKHSSNVPRCSLAIQDVLLRAGFAEGVFQSLLIGSGQVSAVLDDPRVKAATLTGSGPAGSSVAQRAGQNVKKTVLELGGSDPFVVMPSADLERAVETAVTARTLNNGQSCINAKRFIVAGEVYDEFVERLVEKVEALEVGDPRDGGTDMGPLAMPSILEDVDSQVRRTVEGGARVLTGGKPYGGTGNFYPPTVLTNIPEGTPGYEEEIFGPVASVFRVGSVGGAIELANATEFGLGSAAWTDDPAEQEQFINELEAGQVFINSMVASDPRLPFGGVKASGYGRELSEYGIKEFVNAKTISVGKEAERTE